MRINGSVVSIDARASVVSDKGALNLDFAYTGKLHVTEDVIKVFKGTEVGEIEFGQVYYYTTPKITSRSEEYVWVNDTIFVAQGRVAVKEPGKVTVAYRIFKVG